MEHVQNQILVHVMQASMEQYVTEVSILQSSQLLPSFKIDLTSWLSGETKCKETLTMVLLWMGKERQFQYPALPKFYNE